MSSMDRFFTRKSANEGVKLPLYDVNTGSATDDFIRVMNFDSDAYKQASIEYHRRRLVYSGETDKAKTVKLELENQIQLAASLILEWSFDEELNQENAIKFLREAPQIQSMIEKIAGDRQLFFVLKSSDSLTGSQSKQS